MKIKLLLATLAAGVALPGIVAADDSELDAAKKKFSGEYTATASADDERERIDEVIEEVVDDMSRFKRRFARSALEDSTTPCPEFNIRFGSDVMEIHCTSGEPARSYIDGPTVRWTDSDGDEIPLDQDLEADRMIQRFKGEDGERVNEFTLRDGGDTLVKSVTITSDQLPRDVTYTRTFQRQ